MTKVKNILIAVFSLAALAAAAIFIFSYVIANRVNYVPIEEANAIAKQQEEVYLSSIEQGIIEEDLTILESGELNLFEEVNQTVLTPDEIAAMEIEQQLGDVTNVLLIGVDRRGEDEMSRSDTILIATLDKNNGRLKLTSLMRDLYLPIPGRGGNRINYACVRGGPGLLMDTINENFNMELDKYVMVDFRMFEAIVDKLDGITINMSKGEVSEANDCIAGLNKQWKLPLRDGFITQREGGDVHMDGKQALGYARMRHFANGDFSRTSRQYKVLQEIFSKFSGAGIAKQTQLLYELLPMVETNLQTPEILALASAALTIEDHNIMHYRLPVEGNYKSTTVRSMWVLMPDIPANTKKLHWFIYEATQVDPLEGSNTHGGSSSKATVTPKPTTTPDITQVPVIEPESNAEESESAFTAVPQQAASAEPEMTAVPTMEATQAPQASSAPVMQNVDYSQDATTSQENTTASSVYSKTSSRPKSSKSTSEAKSLSNAEIEALGIPEEISIIDIPSEY